MRQLVKKQKTVLLYGIAAVFAAATSAAFFGTANPMENGVRGSLILPAAAFAALFGFYAWTVQKRSVQIRPLTVAAAVLFAFANLFGRSMHYAETLHVLGADALRLLLSAVYLVGFAALFFFLCQWLPVLTAAAGREHPSRFFGKHVFWRALLLLLIAYLPWIAAFYPGCTVMDLYAQLDFYFNGACSYAPVFSSMLTGLCIRVGSKLGSDKFGLFLFFIIQIGVCLIAYAGVIEAMARLRLHRVLLWGTLAYYALLPIFPAYAIIASKDPIFSGFLLLFLSRLALLLCRSGEKPRWTDLLLLFGAALGAGLFRNGGIWLILAGAAVSAFLLRRRLPVSAFAMIAGAVLLFFLWDGVYLPSRSIPVAPKSEAMSIPFQQTARCVREHGDALTQTEREIIDSVLEYDVIGGAYEPLLADNVKSTYRLHNDPEEDVLLGEYFRLWASMLPRYPATYLEALVGNSYGYYAFTPPTRELSYNQNNGMCLFLQTSPYGAEHYPQWDLSMLPAFEGARHILRTAAEGVETVPVLRLLYDCAFYCWLCVMLLVTHRRGKHLGVFIPVLLVMIACIASPVNDCFRYFFAVAAAMPLLLAVCAAARSSENRA